MNKVEFSKYPENDTAQKVMGVSVCPLVRSRDALSVGNYPK